jgi:hypothetical protein
MIFDGVSGKSLARGARKRWLIYDIFDAWMLQSRFLCQTGPAGHLVFHNGPVGGHHAIFAAAGVILQSQKSSLKGSKKRNRQDAHR